MEKMTKIYCPYCKRPITYSKLLKRKEVDVEIWQWAFDGLYCPYEDCKKFIELDEHYEVKGDYKMKSFDKFVEEIERLESEYGVKIQFTIEREKLMAAKTKDEKDTAEKIADELEDKDNAKVDETPKKKRGAKKEEKEKEKADEKPVKKTPISDESLDEIEDKANEIFDENEDDVDAFYDHLCKEFGVDNEVDLYEEDKDEVMEMLKFLEDNPDAAIEDAKRYGQAKKSRRK